MPQNHQCTTEQRPETRTRLARQTIPTGTLLVTCLWPETSHRTMYASSSALLNRTSTDLPGTEVGKKQVPANFGTAESFLITKEHKAQRPYLCTCRDVDTLPKRNSDFPRWPLWAPFFDFHPWDNPLLLNHRSLSKILFSATPNILKFIRLIQKKIFFSHLIPYPTFLGQHLSFVHNSLGWSTQCSISSSSSFQLDQCLKAKDKSAKLRRANLCWHKVQLRQLERNLKSQHNNFCEAVYPAAQRQSAIANLVSKWRKLRQWRKTNDPTCFRTGVSVPHWWHTHNVCIYLVPQRWSNSTWCMRRGTRTCPCTICDVQGVIWIKFQASEMKVCCLTPEPPLTTSGKKAFGKNFQSQVNGGHFVVGRNNTSTNGFQMRQTAIYLGICKSSYVILLASVVDVIRSGFIQVEDLDPVTDHVISSTAWPPFKSTIRT